MGEYLALDLGGTNLRVCLVTLQGEGKFEVTQTKYRLTEEQKQEDGQKLYVSTLAKLMVGSTSVPNVWTASSRKLSVGPRKMTSCP